MKHRVYIFCQKGKLCISLVYQLINEGFSEQSLSFILYPMCQRFKNVHYFSYNIVCIRLSWLLQRARFKAVESLQQQEDTDGSDQFPTIVVATDVAARGLDIPSVATVIHYDAARTVDTFIHRSGRTAVRKNHCLVFLLWSPI